MYTNNQEENYGDNLQVRIHLSADDRNDDEKRREEGLEDEQLEEGGEWGEVDPAGGPSPSAPGSAV